MMVAHVVPIRLSARDIFVCSASPRSVFLMTALSLAVVWSSEAKSQHIVCR